jgi:hypothetical protein
VAERPWQAAGAGAVAVGSAAVLAPGHLAAVFGLPAPDGSAALAWRLFGIRTAVVGAGIVRGSPDARRVLLPVQALDQAAFLAAGRAGAVPWRSVRRLCVASWAMVLLGVAARGR